MTNDVMVRSRGKAARVLLGLGLTAALCASARPVSAGPAAILTIEQDGRPLSITDGAVSLRRAPFTVTVVLVPGGTAQLSASVASGGYDLARAGGSLSSVFQPGGGFAEAEGNADRTLYLRPGDHPGHHVWDVLADRPHRFDGVSPHGPRLVGRRTVAAFTLDRVRHEIETWPGGDVFLVYRAGDAAGREDGRAAVRLGFPPVPASATAKPAAPASMPTFSTVTTVVGVARPMLTIGTHGVSRADFERVYRRYQRFNAHLARTDPSLAQIPGEIVVEVIRDELALADARRLGIEVSTAEAETRFLQGVAIEAGRPLDPAAARAKVMAMYPMLTYDDIIETGRRVLVTQRVVAAVLGDVPAEHKQDLKRAYLADATRRLRPTLDREALLAMYAGRP